jgi:hypothetical protein
MQIPTCAGNLLKKIVIGNKTKPLSSQRVGHEIKQPGVTWLLYFVMSSRSRK